MALTATVTKVSVTSNDVDEFTIQANLKVNNGTVDVIDRNFSVRYTKRNNLDTVVEAEKRLQGVMQKTIDLYKSDKVIFGSAALDNSITNIQNNLVM